MVKRAVLYTGQLRTVKKTIKFFKRNILLDPDVHVFCCIENDTSQTNDELENWLREEMKDNLKSLIWFNLDDYPDWNKQRIENIDKMNTFGQYKHFLKCGGAVIEYFQLNLAYKNMYYFEDSNNFLYDYIIRIRPDNIVLKPIDFHWLEWTEKDVLDRFDKIKGELLAFKDINDDFTVLKYFMNTIISDEILNNMKNNDAMCFLNSSKFIPSREQLFDYIKNGSYILTLRKNNIYIVKRQYFYLIPSLAYMYGILKAPFSCPLYWFDSESQFQAACYHSNLTIYNYDTHTEGESVCNYNEKRYFNDDYEVIDDKILYICIRY
jgi:hypothetical protein